MKTESRAFERPFRTDQRFSGCETRRLRAGKFSGKPCVHGPCHDGDHEDEDGKTWHPQEAHRLGFKEDEPRKKVEKQTVATHTVIAKRPCCGGESKTSNLLPYDEMDFVCGTCKRNWNVTFVPNGTTLTAEFEEATVALEFFCDSEGCEAAIPTKKKLISEARMVAKRAGWAHEGDKDFCPDHKEAW